MAKKKAAAVKADVAARARAAGLAKALARFPRDVEIATGLTMEKQHRRDRLRLTGNGVVTETAAAVYAGDYRWETWRLISARNGRPWLILGKIGVMKVLAMIAMLAMLIAAFIFFVTQALVAGRPMIFGIR